jgi:hypothetical protein
MSRRIIAARRYSATSRRRSAQARALEMSGDIKVASLARASKLVAVGACAAAAGPAVPHAERKGGRVMDPSGVRHLPAEQTGSGPQRAASLPMVVCEW